MNHNVQAIRMWTKPNTYGNRRTGYLFICGWQRVWLDDDQVPTYDAIRDSERCIVRPDVWGLSNAQIQECAGCAVEVTVTATEIKRYRKHYGQFVNSVYYNSGKVA